MKSDFIAPSISISKDLDESKTKPLLWNPVAAVYWSLFLTPIFSAIIHMKNWETLGEKRLAFKSKIWSIGIVIVYFFMFIAMIFCPDSKVVDTGLRATFLATFLLWYGLCAYEQMKFITIHYNGSYIKKGWSKPILYFFKYLIIVIFVIFVISAFLAIVFNLNE